MNQLTLYFFPGTCARVSMIALNEAGASYDAKLVNFFKGEHKSPEYLAKNPSGKVPALLIDGNPLTETIAILHYLHDHYPAAKLLPYNGDRKHDTHVLSDLAWLNSTMQPLLTRYRVPMAFTHMPEAFRDIAQIGAELMRHHFGLIEQRLATQPYIGGNEYSMLDALAVWLFDESRNAGLATDDFPKFQALAAQVMARPAVQAALGREGAAMGQVMAEGPPPPPMPKFL